MAMYHFTSPFSRDTPLNSSRIWTKPSQGKILWAKEKVKPDETELTELIATWFPTEQARRLALTDNPEELYGF